MIILLQWTRDSHTVQSVWSHKSVFWLWKAGCCVFSFWVSIMLLYGWWPVDYYCGYNGHFGELFYIYSFTLVHFFQSTNASFCQPLRGKVFFFDYTFYAPKPQINPKNIALVNVNKFFKSVFFTSASRNSTEVYLLQWTVLHCLTDLGLTLSSATLYRSHDNW